MAKQRVAHDLSNDEIVHSDDILHRVPFISRIGDVVCNCFSNLRQG